MTLPVNEIFPTIQGEGTFTGKAAWFVRLQGCPVGCAWCDTKHTWERDTRYKADTVDILRKDAGPVATWAEFGIDSILAALRSKPRLRHVVITGGEPCMHDLTELTDRLEAAGYSTQIETSCTFPIRTSYETWVTASPKWNMPGGLAVRPDALRRANEIKHPVGKAADIDNLRSLLAHVRPGTPVYLQPLSQSAKATRLCVEAAMDNGWNVSIQTHKFIGLR